MNVSDNAAGTKVAGLIFDAGTQNSSVLLQVGASDRREYADRNGPVNPTSLHDVFFRIGGATMGKATASLVVNSDNVLLDDVWAWRADQGATGWTLNTADTGVIVNGNNVTAYGLFVDHFQKYEVVWNGENGRTIFFENEMPTDQPNQAAWMHSGVNGFAAYKVADSVHTHEAWGMDSACFFFVDPTIHSARAFEVSVRPNVRLHDILTVNLSAGTIDHVVNDTGAPVNSAAIGVPSYVLSFP